MHSKNKKTMTKQEREWVQRVAQLPCVVCGSEEGSEVHEPEQGAWFASIALCPACHRGTDGWHGTRRRWTLRRINEIQAINETVRKAYA